MCACETGPWKRGESRKSGYQLRSVTNASLQSKETSVFTVTCFLQLRAKGETLKGNYPNYNSKESLILILILKLHY